MSRVSNYMFISGFLISIAACATEADDPQGGAGAGSASQDASQAADDTAQDPTEAAPAPDLGAISDPELAAALARLFDGTSTPQDLDLIRRDPQVAAYVPDPSGEEITSTESVPVAMDEVIDASAADASEPSARVDAARAKDKCWSATVTVTQKSILAHTVLYKWNHVVSWCGNAASKRVTRWVEWYDNVSDINSLNNVKVGKLTVHSRTSTPVYNVATAFRQRHIQYCIPRIGCYGNKYPHSKIWVYWWGGHQYTSGR